MNFTQVKTVPKTGARNNLQVFITEFMDSDFDYAKIETADGEYVSTRGCASAINNAAKKYKFNCKAVIRAGCVYIVRTDRGDFKSPVTKAKRKYTKTKNVNPKNDMVGK